MMTPSLRRSFVLANAGPLTPAQRRAMFAKLGTGRSAGAPRSPPSGPPVDGPILPRPAEPGGDSRLPIIGYDPAGRPIYDPRYPHVPEDPRFRDLRPGDQPSGSDPGGQPPARARPGVPGASATSPASPPAGPAAALEQPAPVKGPGNPRDRLAFEELMRRATRAVVVPPHPRPVLLPPAAKSRAS